jgi:hypothetical protein
MQYVPETAVIRPILDRLIVQAFDVIESRILIVPYDGKPLRGRVLAAGPGRFRIAYDAPRRYDTDPYDPGRRKRKLMWETKTWVPVETRVGDIIEVGGRNIGGYSFDTFYWGDKYCFCCSEQDVCGIDEGGMEAAGSGDPDGALERPASSASA